MIESDVKLVYQRPLGFEERGTHYCPGCTHGVAHRLIAEVLEEMGELEHTIGVAPVGCAVFAYNYFAFDFVEAPHGRAPAMATGIKRTLPDRMVFTYQGDGDLAAIGTAEIVHAANRGEHFSVFFVNNAIYGMTGGQMAPTTLPDMKTTTSPYGRNVDDIGYPIRVCELLATLVAPYYIERVSLLSPAEIIKAKKAVDKAIRYNKEGRGFTFVEFVSTCPTNWGFDPVKSRDWARENMLPFFKPAVFRDKGEGVE